MKLYHALAVAAALFVASPASALVVQGDGTDCPKGWSSVASGRLMVQTAMNSQLLDICVPLDQACTCKTPGNGNLYYWCPCSTPGVFKRPTDQYQVEIGTAFQLSGVSCKVCIPAVTK